MADCGQKTNAPCVPADDKQNPDVAETITTITSSLRSVPEPMEMKLNKLKNRRKSQAYTPVILNILKTYDEFVANQIQLYDAAQKDKIRINQQRTDLEQQMIQYKFRDYKAYTQCTEHLKLLMTRISKQDEAISYVIEILKKMEKVLGDAYEKKRDLEDQIKMLNAELEVKITENRYPKGMTTITEENLKPSQSLMDLAATNEEEEDEDEDEDIDDDKRMVLILAYAVCKQDFDNASKRIKYFERKYANVASRHELKEIQHKLAAEKVENKELEEDMPSLEAHLVEAKEQEKEFYQELESIDNMEDEEKDKYIRQRFMEDRPMLILATRNLHKRKISEQVGESFEEENGEQDDDEDAE